MANIYSVVLSMVTYVGLVWILDLSFSGIRILKNSDSILAPYEYGYF